MDTQLSPSSPGKQIKLSVKEGLPPLLSVSDLTYLNVAYSTSHFHPVHALNQTNFQTCHTAIA